MPKIMQKFTYSHQVDLVFDQPDSIKADTRIGRGDTGKRRKVGLNVKIPGNWKEFLSCSKNKTELFPLISERLIATAELPDHKVLFATVRDKCVSTDTEADLSLLSPTDHEEADTRMFLHMLSGANNSHRKILIQANDTDVIILGLRAFALKDDIMEELWITYSTGSKFCYVAIHQVVQSIGKPRAMAMPAYHAFTGCDTTSTFFGRGKKTTHAIWMKYLVFDSAFLEMSSDNLGEKDLQRLFITLQKFVCLLYGSEKDALVDDARRNLLINNGKDFDDMPPSSDALYQHFLRACLQSAHIWSKLFQAVFNDGLLLGWGWQLVGDTPVPVYVTKNIISKDMRELSRCGCKINCKGNCGCKRDPVQPCTRLCGCQGNCKSDDKTLRATQPVRKENTQ